MRGLFLVCAILAGCSRREEGPKHDAAPPSSASAPATASPPAFVIPSGLVRARAFVFNRDPQIQLCSSILTHDGRLCPSARGEDIPLSREQLERAVVAFTAPPRQLDTAPWCFEPHHGIVLYDASDKPVAAMSVCFECEREGLWPAPRDQQDAIPPMSERTEQAFRKLFCEDLQLTPCDR